MSSSVPEILALGEPLIEFVRLPDQGGRILYEQGYGGDTSNAIIAAARQGASTGYITAIGNDPFGDALLSLWKREGVSTEWVEIFKGDPTGAYFVQPHASGRQFSYARRGSAASRYTREILPRAVIKRARIIHSSAISLAISASMRETVLSAAEIARQSGTLFSFDTNLRLNLWTLDEARNAINDILPLVSIVMPSVDEAELLTGHQDPNAIVDHFLGRGANIVVLKLGDRGAIIADGDKRHKIPPAPSSAADSTGAGDSFAGAFLAYYLEIENLQRAGELAAIVAAGTVGGLGAVDPIPFRSDVFAS